MHGVPSHHSVLNFSRRLHAWPLVMMLFFILAAGLIKGANAGVIVDGLGLHQLSVQMSPKELVAASCNEKVLTNSRRSSTEDTPLTAEPQNTADAVIALLVYWPLVQLTSARDVFPLYHSSPFARSLRQRPLNPRAPPSLSV